jgi:hypothetical protein
MNEIKRGTMVRVRDAKDRLLTRIALSGIVAGKDFPIVWVCVNEEWEAAQAENREPVGIPWPAVAVTSGVLA